jgi:hypothetical protein
MCRQYFKWLQTQFYCSGYPTILQNQKVTRLAEEPSVARQDSVPRSKLDSDLFVLSVSITIIVMTATIKIPHSHTPSTDPFESLIGLIRSELRLPGLKLHCLEITS